MSREIKFRGKRVDNNEWVYGWLISSPDGTILTICPKGMSDYNNYVVEKESIGQFTGLQDKDGKDIYEGDIVGTHCFNEDRKHMVELTREGWKAGGYHLDSIYYTGSSKFKVLGNIYENPELLNTQTKTT